MGSSREEIRVINDFVLGRNRLLLVQPQPLALRRPADAGGLQRGGDVTCALILPATME